MQWAIALDNNLLTNNGFAQEVADRELLVERQMRDLSGKLSARGAELSTKMSVLRVEVQAPRCRGVVVIDGCL